jgi:hypothetical protein
LGGFKPEFRGAEDLEVVLRAIYNHTWAYDPIPSSIYRCSNPDSHSKKYALDEQCLTASFRAYVSLQEKYTIPEKILKQKATTIASKAIMNCQSSQRQRVIKLVWPYLSIFEKLVFSITAYVPSVYTWLNSIRNRLRGPQYGPRKEIHPS